MTKKIRTVFMGTPAFALPGLAALIADKDFEIVGIFTQPDRPVGRKYKLTPPPVKELALASGLAIFQPEKIKTEIETIKQLSPDIIVVIAYGQIIPQAILDIPVHGGINVHASLLPLYRGAACLNAPILNGDTETGITIMKMEAGLDTGPIFRQAKIVLDEKETLSSLHDRLAQLGAALLPGTLKDIIRGKIEPKDQDNSLASYVPTINKNDGHINWSKDAKTIERMARAYNPWPGTYSILEKDSSSRTLKILEFSPLILKENSRRPGEIFRHNKGLAVQCGQDSLVILKLQIAGGRLLKAEDFLSGNTDLIGKVLD